MGVQASVWERGKVTKFVDLAGFENLQGLIKRERKATPQASRGERRILMMRVAPPIEEAPVARAGSLARFSGRGAGAALNPTIGNELEHLASMQSAICSLRGSNPKYERAVNISTALSWLRGGGDRGKHFYDIFADPLVLRTRSD